MTGYLQRSENGSWFSWAMITLSHWFQRVLQGDKKNQNTTDTHTIKNAADEIPGYSCLRHMLWPHSPAPSLLITILNHNSFCNALKGVLLLTSLYSWKNPLVITLCFLLFNWDLILNMTCSLSHAYLFPLIISSEGSYQKPFETANNLHPVFYEPLQHSLEGEGAQLTLTGALLVSS